MDGYLRLADQVRAASTALRDGIEAIAGLHVTGNPVPGVMEIAADEGVDIGAVADASRTRLAPRPPAGRAACHRVPVPRGCRPELLADLADAVARDGESRGVEARYGGVG